MSIHAPVVGAAGQRRRSPGLAPDPLNANPRGGVRGPCIVSQPGAAVHSSDTCRGQVVVVGAGTWKLRKVVCCVYALL